MEIKFDYLPERPVKPRSEGLTIIRDDGLGLNDIEDIVSTYGHLIDLARISPGALCSGEALSKRADKYKQAGISPFISGILFEAAYIRNSVNEYLDLLEANNFGYIEVSDCIVEIPPKEKAEIIKNLSKRFIVFSKIGTKFKNVFFSNEKWKDYIMAESEAGSRKIIIEGGEAGTSPVISGKIDIKLSLVNHILDFANIEDIIWEAPHHEQQTWFINKFGANVNLADIYPRHVPGLEGLRSGIHWETFVNYLPGSLTEGKLRKADPLFDIDFQI